MNSIQIQYEIDTIFMNSKNSKTFSSNRLIFQIK